MKKRRIGPFVVCYAFDWRGSWVVAEGGAKWRVPFAVSWVEKGFPNVLFHVYPLSFGIAWRPNRHARG